MMSTRRRTSTMLGGPISSTIVVAYAILLMLLSESTHSHGMIAGGGIGAGGDDDAEIQDVHHGGPTIPPPSSASSSSISNSSASAVANVEVPDVHDGDPIIPPPSSSSSSSSSASDGLVVEFYDRGGGGGGGKSDKHGPYVLFENTFNCDEEDDDMEGRGRDRSRRRRRTGKAGKACKGDTSEAGGDGSNVEGGIDTEDDVVVVVVPTSSPIGSTTSSPVVEIDDGEDEDDQIEAACDALSQGNMPSLTTSMSSREISYAYELSIENGMDVDVVVGAMEDALSSYVGAKLIGCDDLVGEARERRRGMSFTPTSTMTVVGVTNDPADTSSENTSCMYFVDDGAIESSSCHVVYGGMMLYFSEHSTTDDWGNGLLDALGKMMEAMNDIDPSPFLGSTDGAYGVASVTGVRFIEGGDKSPDGGLSVVGEDGISYDDDNLEAPIDVQTDASAATAATQGRDSRISTLGGLMLGLGILAFVALMLLTARKVRTYMEDERFREFKNESGEIDGDFDGTDVDDASLASSPRKKNAYVVGEEGSVRTFATHDTRIFHAAREVSNDNGDDLRLDVHYCSSALCRICNRGGGPKFVSAVDDDEASTVMVNEGYEFALEDMHKRSFEYKPREDASVPSYSNPAGMAARPYIVDDTVEL